MNPSDFAVKWARVTAYRLAKETGIPQPLLSAVLAQHRDISRTWLKSWPPTSA